MIASSQHRVSSMQAKTKESGTIHMLLPRHRVLQCCSLSKPRQVLNGCRHKVCRHTPRHAHRMVAASMRALLPRAQRLCLKSLAHMHRCHFAAALSAHCQNNTALPSMRIRLGTPAGKRSRAEEQARLEKCQDAAEGWHFLEHHHTKAQIWESLKREAQQQAVCPSCCSSKTY